MPDGSRKKITVATFAAGMVLGLLFASVSFTAWHWYCVQKTLYCFTSSQAKLISSNVQSSLVFNDSKDANGVLDSLKSQHSIVFGCIYDSKGNLFASYCRDDFAHKGFKPPRLSKAKLKFRAGCLIVSEPVIVEECVIGTVCLWAKS
jgi:hypothetical protein